MKKSLLLLTTILLLGLGLMGCEQRGTFVDEDSASPFAPMGLSFALLPDGATIDSVQVHFYLQDVNYKNIYLHRVTADWAEHEVTWNSFGGAYDPAVIASFDASALGWISLDITPLATDWMNGVHENFGFIFIADSTAVERAIVKSKEADEDLPYIEVHYNVNGVPGSETGLPIADACIFETDPDTNWGSLDKLYVGKRNADDLVKQSLMRFELPELPEPPLYGSIGDLVWLDTDNDGLQDLDEIGVGDIEVHLLDNMGNLLANTLTNQAGAYLFGDLLPGVYLIEVLPGDDYIFSPMDMGDDALDSDIDPYSGQSAPITLGLGESILTIDAGLFTDGGEDCGECEDKVTQLTMRYDGDEGRLVKIYQGKRRWPHRLLYSAYHEPGDEFTFDGIRPDGTMGNKISIWLGCHRNVIIKTNCTEPIGPGLIVGDFEILAGSSLHGGALCPLEIPEEECGECEGQITELTLRYGGDEMAYIEVYQGNRRRFRDLIFAGVVMPDGEFSFSGRKNHGKMGSKITVYTNIHHTTSIHTSCSQPIGVGMVVGQFEIIAGASHEGGPLCEID